MRLQRKITKEDYRVELQSRITKEDYRGRNIQVLTTADSKYKVTRYLSHIHCEESIESFKSSEYANHQTAVICLLL